jgi:hypothetical protein
LDGAGIGGRPMPVDDEKQKLPALRSEKLDLLLEPGQDLGAMPGEGAAVIPDGEGDEKRQALPESKGSKEGSLPRRIKQEGTAPDRQSLLEASEESSRNDPHHDTADIGAVGQAGARIDTAAWLASGVETELGGVLYLVNLMHYLGLPERFEKGWRLASEVGAWGTLDALARALLGERFTGLQHDAIWAALAQLDRREAGQPPGCRLPETRPRRWPVFQAPEDWQVGEDRTRFLVRAGLLRVSSRPLLDRWLGLALPFIIERLRLALDLSSEAADAGEAEIYETLLHLPGRLYVSATHIDLTTSLQHTSLRVRSAGLDRNPGWAPDFGRVIYFHFE